MRRLFSEDGLRLLDSLAFTKTLYAFDFDGTLARIVAVPTDAHMKPSTEKLLRALHAKAPVAVVSGRGVSDLRARLPFRPKFLIGNHGHEGLPGSRESLKRAKTACVKWRRALSNGLAIEKGVEIEDKTYSLAVHYRHSKRKALVRRQIMAIVAAMDPAPRVVPGKAVVNLVPEGAADKGFAVRELLKLSGAKQAFYIGDDDTDEDVFRLPDSRIFSVRVGKKRGSQASFYIERMSDIDRVLRHLLKSMGPTA